MADSQEFEPLPAYLRCEYACTFSQYFPVGFTSFYYFPMLPSGVQVYIVQLLNEGDAINLVFGVQSKWESQQRYLMMVSST